MNLMMSWERMVEELADRYQIYPMVIIRAIQRREIGRTYMKGIYSNCSPYSRVLTSHVPQFDS